MRLLTKEIDAKLPRNPPIGSKLISTELIKPYHTTTRGVLYDNDCVKVLRSLQDGVIDCIFADPPFNIGKDYKNGFNDKVSEVQYYAWCKMWIEECSRVLKPGGAFFLYALPEIAVKLAHFMNESLDFRHWIALTMKGSYSRGKSSTRLTTHFFTTHVVSRDFLTRFGFLFLHVDIAGKKPRIMAVIEIS